MANRIKKSKADVFIPSDFFDMSGYDQVLRVLRNMVRDKKLIKIGRGIYARTKTFSDGTIAPIAFIGELAQEALRKYGVKTGPSACMQAYNNNLSSQVPNGRVIAVNKRVRRNISFNGYKISYEMMNNKYLTACRV